MDTPNGKRASKLFTPLWSHCSGQDHFFSHTISLGQFFAQWAERRFSNRPRCEILFTQCQQQHVHPCVALQFAGALLPQDGQVRNCICKALSKRPHEDAFLEKKEHMNERWFLYSLSSWERAMLRGPNQAEHEVVLFSVWSGVTVQVLAFHCFPHLSKSCDARICPHQRLPKPPENHTN